MYVCVFCIEKNERQTAETNSIKTKTKRSVVVVPDWCQSHRTVVQATNVHRSQLVGTNMYIHAIKFVVVAAAQTKFIVINLCNHIYCVCCAVCVCVSLVHAVTGGFGVHTHYTHAVNSRRRLMRNGF